MSSSEEEEEKDVNIMDSEGEEASQDMAGSHQMSFGLDMESQDMDNDQCKPRNCETNLYYLSIVCVQYNYCCI